MRKLIVVGLVMFLACGKAKQQDLFTKGKVLGEVDNNLVEASGLVASANNKGYFWAHNDSDNPAEIFLIDKHAAIKLVCKFGNLKNRDWEDIAVGAGPKQGKIYIYVGDIGDNKALYDVKLIYRFEEPIVSDQKEIVILDYDTLIVKLSDGVRDSEALMIDPISKDMFLFSKREDSVRLYQIHFPYQQDTLLAKRIAILPYHNINAADISVDGSEILIKDYDTIYYWKKERNESIHDLIMKKPIKLPYDKGPQDEAIAWLRDGSGFCTLGESVKGKKGELVLHKRK